MSMTAECIENDLDFNKFYEVGIEVSRRLASKYFTVAWVYSPEDVVQEAVLKLLRQGVNTDLAAYSFKSFVSMVINTMYIDLARSKVVKNTKEMSYLDSKVRGKDDAENRTLGDTIDSGVYVEEEVLGSIAAEEILDSLPSNSNRVANTPEGVMNLSVRNIAILKLAGYTNVQIAEWFGVKNISNYLKKGKELVYA